MFIKELNFTLSECHIFSVQSDLLTSVMRSTATGVMLSSSTKNEPKYDMIEQIQVIDSLKLKHQKFEALFLLMSHLSH